MQPDFGGFHENSGNLSVGPSPKKTGDFRVKLRMSVNGQCTTLWCLFAHFHAQFRNVLLRLLPG